jgi:hypothetical protein
MFDGATQEGPIREVGGAKPSRSLRSELGAVSRRIVIGLGALVLGVVVVPAIPSVATGDHDAVDYAQCANKTDDNQGCTKWINGILNTNNSFYRENEVTPQRLAVSVEAASDATECNQGADASSPADDTVTGCHSVTISYLARKGNHHAYDSLASVDTTQGMADDQRCDGLTTPVKNAIGCGNAGTSSDTLAITEDTTEVFPVGPDKDARTNAHDLSGQQLQIFSAAATGVELVQMTAPTHSDAGVADQSNYGDDYATTTIYYRTAGPGKVQLLFGGHLAPGPQAIGWGEGFGASDISGGPYHIRWTHNDAASAGSRDNQIMSGAIQPLATTAITTLVSLRDSATIVGYDTTGDGTGDVTFSLYGPADATCTGTPVFTETVPDIGDSATVATTSGYEVPASAEGVYKWVVTYSGDNRNAASSSACGSEAADVQYN